MTSSSNSVNVVLRNGIVVLTLGTALIHFSLNFPDPGFTSLVSGTLRCWQCCTYRSCR